MYRCIVATAAFSLLAACSFVSKGTVVVSGNCLGCTQALTDDAVARAIGPLLEHRGFRPSSPQKSAGSPCTGARGCSWAPEGKGWLQPWVMVESPASGRVKIRIEARHDDPRQDIRVRELAEELAKAMREQFGSATAVVEQVD